MMCRTSLGSYKEMQDYFFITVFVFISFYGWAESIQPGRREKKRKRRRLLRILLKGKKDGGLHGTLLLPGCPSCAPPSQHVLLLLPLLLSLMGSGSIFTSPREERKTLWLLRPLLRGKEDEGLRGASFLGVVLSFLPPVPLILLLPFLLPLLPPFPSAQMRVLLGVFSHGLIVSFVRFVRSPARFPHHVHCSAASFSGVLPTVLGLLIWEADCNVKSEQQGSKDDFQLWPPLLKTIAIRTGTVFCREIEIFEDGSKCESYENPQNFQLLDFLVAPCQNQNLGPL